GGEFLQGRLRPARRVKDLAGDGDAELALDLTAFLLRLHDIPRMGLLSLSSFVPRASWLPSPPRGEGSTFAPAGNCCTRGAGVVLSTRFFPGARLFGRGPGSFWETCIRRSSHATHGGQTVSAGTDAAARLLGGRPRRGQEGSAEGRGGLHQPLQRQGP